MELGAALTTTALLKTKKERIRVRILTWFQTQLSTPHSSVPKNTKAEATPTDLPTKSEELIIVRPTPSIEKSESQFKSKFKRKIKK